MKNALKNTYEPRHIFRKLSELKPFFYPEPVKAVAEVGQKTIMADPDIPFLTKDELLSLWNEAGDVLHRTPMARVYSAKRTNFDQGRLSDINVKLAGLLANHWITLVENQKGIHVMLSSEDGMPQAHVLDFGVASERAKVAVASFQFLQPSI
jgi:hypothetical protein